LIGGRNGGGNTDLPARGKLLYARGSHPLRRELDVEEVAGVDAIAHCGRQRADDVIPPPNNKPFEMASRRFTGLLTSGLHPETAVTEATTRMMMIHMLQLPHQTLLSVAAECGAWSKKIIIT